MSACHGYQPYWCRHLAVGSSSYHGNQVCWSISNTYVVCIYTLGDWLLAVFNFYKCMLYCSLIIIMIKYDGNLLMFRWFPPRCTLHWLFQPEPFVQRQFLSPGSMEIDPFLKGDIDFAMDQCISDIIYSIVNYVIAIANILCLNGAVCVAFSRLKNK